MPEFKIGDVVRLKSGGPAMTVIEVESHRVATIWFDHDGAEPQRYCFTNDALCEDPPVSA